MLDIVFFFSTFPYMMACSKSTLSCFWWDVQDIVLLLICPYLFTGLFSFICNVLCPGIFWTLFDKFKLQSTLEKRTVRQMDAYRWLNLLSYYSFSLCTNYLFTAFFVCIFISTKMLISARNVFRRNSLFFEGRTALTYLELKTFVPRSWLNVSLIDYWKKRKKDRASDKHRKLHF